MARRSRDESREETWGEAVPAPEYEAYFQGLEKLGPGGLTGGMIDGLLAAVLTAPTHIETEAWVASLWSLEEGDPEPDPDNPETALAVASVFRRFEAIVDEIEDGAYAPLLDVSFGGDFVWQTWVEGFMIGMRLDMDGWADRFGERSTQGDATGLMLTLHGLARNDPETLERLTPQEAAKLRKHAPDLLTECVLELAGAYMPSTPIVRGPKTGRNDPCPCGSGKKFKKCCGAS